jgi:pyruvate formate lyase activating enzyme
MMVRLPSHMTRREFVAGGFACGLALAPGCAFAKGLFSGPKNEKTVTLNDAPDTLWKWSKEVYFRQELPNGRVRCMTCPNMCLLPPGARSRCGSHINRGGKLYTLVYGNPCAVHVDPIEKKPLYHFLPSSQSFSIATTGCSFNCLNCQNWEISQSRPEEVKFDEMFPPAVVDNALRAGCASIAYTYSEPTTFFEYMLDTSRIARERKVRNVWVTNGYITEAALAEYCKTLDAANVDVKGFSEESYATLNAGRLAPVLAALRMLSERNVWFEMTALIVPTYSDDMDAVKRMCGWIVKNIGRDHPLHFSRFSPKYRLTHLPMTSISFLEEARKAAIAEGLHYVYVGNVPPSDSSHTYCPSCRKRIVSRMGFGTGDINIKGGACAFCGYTIAGVWG